MLICVSTMNNLSGREARQPEGQGEVKRNRSREGRGARNGRSQKETRGQGQGRKAEGESCRF